MLEIITALKTYRQGAQPGHITPIYALSSTLLVLNSQT